jgi:hypothetical protein
MQIRKTHIESSEIINLNLVLRIYSRYRMIDTAVPITDFLAVFCRLECTEKLEIFLMLFSQLLDLILNSC